MTTIDNKKKWNISLFSAFLFFIVIHPYTYNFTNKLLNNMFGIISNNGCPTNTGIILHTIVYLLLVRYFMDIKLF